MSEVKVTKQKEPVFTKSQLIKAKRYADRTDMLNVILEDGKNYTIKEVEKLIDGFMKKEVK